MKQNQKGFSVVGLILAVVVVGVIAAVGWLVLSKRSGPAERLKDRAYNIYLDGATDDSLVNYYKLGVDLRSTSTVRLETMPALGATPCPETDETYQVKPTYTENTLTLTMADYQRVENPKDMDSFDKRCKILPDPEKKFDLDKEWLATPGVKMVKTVGLDGRNYTLDTSGRKLTLSDGSSTISQLPFYPDKVAVMVAAGGSCSGDFKTYLQSQGIVLADPRYPQLDALYRRPGIEVHVILDALKDTDGNKYEKSGCKIRTSKPNLKDLR